MTAEELPHSPPGEGTLHRWEAAVRKREEIVTLREQMLDAMTEFRQSQSAELQTQLDDGKEVNAQLVVTALRRQALAEAVQEASARKDEFIAVLSHELRNPLAPMHNVIEILGRIVGAEPQLPWIHDVLERQVRQLTHLLDDLLEAARVRTGKLVLKRQPVEVHGAIEQALESIRPLADSRGQRLAVTLPAESIWLDADPVRVAQIFANLLNNASKYSGPGGTITVRLRRNEATLVVTVADDGCGISAEALHRIFELFAQEDQSLAHAQGGLGIGLAVARELAQLHGGSIDATSEGLGLGSEFRVTLPLLAEAGTEGHGAAGSSADRRHYESRRRPLLAVVVPRPLSIVLIEDNVDANQSLAALLAMVGHDVESAYDGATGVALVLAKQPQVVVCDLGLPGLDGLQVAARLRAELRPPQPLLIAMTGYGQIADIERSKAAGFDAHLVKPVEPAVLLALLEREAERLQGSAGLAH